MQEMQDTQVRSKVDKIPWRRKGQPTPVFLPGKSQDRGAWQATVHEVARVRYNLATKPPPPTEGVNGEEAKERNVMSQIMKSLG